MLMGEVRVVQAIDHNSSTTDGPIPGDFNISFSLQLDTGQTAMLQPVRFSHYRENSLDIWGQKGRLAIMQEGLSIVFYPQCKNRAMQGEQEIASDQPKTLESTVGHAFYRMYTNLADAVHQQTPLWSPGESALQTARVIEAVVDSAQRGGMPVKLGG
jgi:predicted dehydrogenase